MTARSHVGKMRNRCHLRRVTTRGRVIEVRDARQPRHTNPEHQLLAALLQLSARPSRASSTRSGASLTGLFRGVPPSLCDLAAVVTVMAQVFRLTGQRISRAVVCNATSIT